MKKVTSLLLAVFSLFTLATIAQPQLTPLTIQILLQQRPRNAPAARGTGAQERLIGYMRIGYNSSTGSVDGYDTARYYYGVIDHGTYLDNNYPDTYTQTIFNGNTIMTWQALRYFVHPAIGFDSASYTVKYPAGNIDRHLISRAYNGRLLTRQDDTITSAFTYPLVNPDGDHYRFAYNVDSQIIRADYDIISISDVSGTSYRTYANGREVKDSFVNPLSNPASVIDYTYDQTGNLTSATYRNWGYGYTGQIRLRDSYTYTPDNMLQSYLFETRDSVSGSLRYYSTDSFSYTGNLLGAVSYYTWNLISTSWQGTGYYRYQYHFDALGNIDTMLQGFVLSSGFGPTGKTVYTYTTANHFDQIISYSAGSNGTFNPYPSGRIKFYYDLAGPSSIRSSSSSNVVQIYPNPAGSTLFIRLKQSANEEVKVTVITITGQLLKSATLTTVTTGLPIEDLIPGTYLLNLTNSEGTQSQLFIKQ